MEKCQSFLDFSISVGVPAGLTDTADRLGHKDKEMFSYSLSETLKYVAGIWVGCRCCSGVLLEGPGAGVRGQVAAASMSPAMFIGSAQYLKCSFWAGFASSEMHLNPSLCRKPLGAHWKLQSSVHVWQPGTAAECSPSFSFLLYPVLFRIAATLCSVAGARVMGETAHSRLRLFCVQAAFLTLLFSLVIRK